jgi:endonuclease YncB( thermonuclease family)
MVWMALVPMALLASCYSPTKDFKAKVVGISDGDTIRVQRDRAELRVRLAGVDCPESGQAFGRSAKAHTASLTFGKTVTIRPNGIDRYGRTVAEVLLPDKKSLNQELVGSGLAWWFRRYAPDDTRLERLEAEAKSARRGLWADAHPIAPWEWRHSHVPASTTRAEPSWVSRRVIYIIVFIGLTVFGFRRRIASYLLRSTRMERLGVRHGGIDTGDSLQLPR